MPSTVAAPWANPGLVLLAVAAPWANPGHIPYVFALPRAIPGRKKVRGPARAKSSSSWRSGVPRQ
eukprot:11226518-Alexandrium_andersonii.AAC.1